MNNKHIFKDITDSCWQYNKHQSLEEQLHSGANSKKLLQLLFTSVAIFFSNFQTIAALVKVCIELTYGHYQVLLGALPMLLNL